MVRSFFKRRAIIIHWSRLIINPNHPFAEEEISVDDLKNQNFVSGKPGSATRTWLRETHNVTLDNLSVTAKPESQHAVISAVKISLGISIVPRMACKAKIELGEIKEVRVGELKLMRGNFYIIFNKTTHLSDSTKELLTFLETEKEKLLAM
ncbi:MAG TPA: hypothetical protein ENN38_03160 [Actinobacteria bacterium]|nr:hypothetical protein [Actinomycetota bacterium]